jgi:hypothetical protein
MEILNLGGSFEPSERPAKKKKLRVIIGIGLLAGVMGMGSTLAASITLNSGASVEFGQGVSYTTACDSNITITPLSTFVNASSGDGGANFALTSVKVGDIDSGCAGKYLRLSAYTDSATVGGAYTSSGSGTSSALAFAMGRTSSAKFGVADTRNNVGPCTITLGATTAGSISVARSSSKELTLTFSSSQSGSNYYEPILAAAVDKFALESSAS